MRGHGWTLRFAVLACGVVLLSGQVPSAEARIVGASIADSDWPTLTLRLALEGPVPARVFFMLEGETSGDTVCEPISAQADYPEGSILKPPCESGRTYVTSFPVPPGARVEYRYSMGFYVDEDGGEVYGQRIIWSDAVVMGSSDHSVTVTHRFAGLPATDTAPVTGAPSRPWTPVGLGLLALMTGFGLTAACRLPRHRSARLSVGSRRPAACGSSPGREHPRRRRAPGGQRPARDRT